MWVSCLEEGGVAKKMGLSMPPPPLCKGKKLRHEKHVRGKKFSNQNNKQTQKQVCESELCQKRQKMRKMGEHRKWEN